MVHPLQLLKYASSQQLPLHLVEPQLQQLVSVSGWPLHQQQLVHQLLLLPGYFTWVGLLPQVGLLTQPLKSGCVVVGHRPRGVQLGLLGLSESIYHQLQLLEVHPLQLEPPEGTWHLLQPLLLVYRPSMLLWLIMECKWDTHIQTHSQWMQLLWLPF